MRKHWSTVLVGVITLLLTAWGVVAPMKAAASAPTAASASQAATATAKLKSGRHCTRIYFEGKPARPTAVKLWCDNGKTLIKIKTPGLKVGKWLKVKVRKGHHTVRLVGLVKQRKHQAEIRVNYDKPMKCPDDVWSSSWVIRNPWTQTPGKSRALGGCD